MKKKRLKKAPSILQTLGSNVRKLRIGQGWSQEKLGEECDLHRTYVGGIERGERNVSIINVSRLANSLSVTVPALFREE